MTKRSGTTYEGKARKALAQFGIFSIGLQPDASPDLILPAYQIGLEIKSTRSNRYYTSRDPGQYQYLRGQFSIDWPGYEPYYMIYFTQMHEWKIYSIRFRTPFKASEGIPMDDFIHIIVSQSKIDFNGVYDEEEGVIE